MTLIDPTSEVVYHDASVAKRIRSAISRAVPEALFLGSTRLPVLIHEDSDDRFSESGWPAATFQELHVVRIVAPVIKSSAVAPDLHTFQVSPPAILQKLHSELGLTWDQIARYFGVSRRSVHSWVNGGRISAANEEAILETAELLEQLAFVELNPDERRAELLRQMQTRRAERERNSEEDINRPAITWAEA